MTAPALDRPPSRHSRLPPARRRRPPEPRSGPVAEAALGTALVALALLVVDSGVELLPGGALLGTTFTWGRVLLLVAAAALVVAGARPRHLRTPADPGVALLLVAATASTLRGGFSQAPLRALLTTVALGYLVVVLVRLRPSAVHGLALGAALAVAASGLPAVEQWLDGTETGFWRLGLRSVEGPDGGASPRATGSFANPNLLAAHLVTLLPLALLSLGSVAGPARRVLAGVVGVSALGLLGAASRSSALVVLVVVGVLLVARALGGRRGRGRASPQVLVGLGLAALALLAGTVAALTGRLGGLTGRQDIWRAAFDATGDAPLLGVGVGRAGAVLTARLPDGQPAFHAHDLWLNYLVETGVVGLAGVLVVTAVAFVLAVRHALTGAAEGLAVLAALVGLAIMSVADHPANTSRIATALAVVVGLSVARSGRWAPGRRDVAHAAVPGGSRSGPDGSRRTSSRGGAVAGP